MYRSLSLLLSLFLKLIGILRLQSVLGDEERLDQPLLAARSGGHRNKRAEQRLIQDAGGRRKLTCHSREEHGCRGQLEWGSTQTKPFLKSRLNETLLHLSVLSIHLLCPAPSKSSPLVWIRTPTEMLKHSPTERAKPRELRRDKRQRTSYCLSEMRESLLLSVCQAFH